MGFDNPTESKYVTSDHRVHGSSSAGYKASLVADQQAIFDVKKWLVLEVASSFYPHFSCAESADFSAGSYGSPAPIDPIFNVPEEVFSENGHRNTRDLASAMLTRPKAQKLPASQEVTGNRGFSPTTSQRRGDSLKVTV
jgi:hypothetical protein